MDNNLGSIKSLIIPTLFPTMVVRYLIEPDDDRKKEALCQLAIRMTAGQVNLAGVGDIDFSNRLLSTVGYIVVGHYWYSTIIYRPKKGVASLLLYSMVEPFCLDLEWPGAADEADVLPNSFIYLASDEIDSSPVDIYIITTNR